MLSKAEMDRFESFVLPEPTSGCWLWTGGATPSGHGHFWLRGKTKKAHRISYELKCGPVEDGKIICHKCDVPSCVNPDHLFVGSPADNSRDMVAKARQKKGVDVNTAKITPDAVRHIRAKVLTSREYCDLYGINYRSVWNIQTRKTWRHVQ
jgi:hypothetical protein